MCMSAKSQKVVYHPAYNEGGVPLWETSK